ncbi:hypothetical protein NC653_037163 [Populus alba x Populus x berolinensis]|uniref:Uncharacterized protein n=1 Tax=Populus alba x Populus x berolinensis TaxID=444605 RepID=A0AAD6LE16_9ROSI|nr:hypothetical protein NC653_037163 [Populus alba x Populus x berolinensis]
MAEGICKGTKVIMESKHDKGDCVKGIKMREDAHHKAQAEGRYLKMKLLRMLNYADCLWLYWHLKNQVLLTMLSPGRNTVYERGKHLRR